MMFTRHATVTGDSRGVLDAWFELDQFERKGRPSNGTTTCPK